MTCQHPNCSQSIHSICTNHCHWSLCEKHLNEHKNSLLIEFEEVLEDLIKPTTELSKSIEKIQENFNVDQQKELDYLKQSHQKQLNHIEQQLTEINQFQNQFTKISEHLIEIKSNQQILILNDFQQIEILSKEIHQYQNSLKKFNEEEENLQQSIINNQCPLTHLNNYGLLSTHHVRLCCPTKKFKNLYEHFRNYHHIKTYYANELIQAIRLHLDPSQTKLFPANEQIVIYDDKHPCPLQNVSAESNIRGTPCTSMVRERSLQLHLKIVHRLRLSQIKEIMNSD